MHLYKIQIQKRRHTVPPWSLLSQSLEHVAPCFPWLYYSFKFPLPNPSVCPFAFLAQQIHPQFISSLILRDNPLIASCNLIRLIFFLKLSCVVSYNLVRLALLPEAVLYCVLQLNPFGSSSWSCPVMLHPATQSVWVFFLKLSCIVSYNSVRLGLHPEAVLLCCILQLSPFGSSSWSCPVMLHPATQSVWVFILKLSCVVSYNLIRLVFFLKLSCSPSLWL